MIRLNVGAGDKYIPGAVNCDRHGDQDVNCDAFPLPFPTDHADEIWAIHLLEHIPRFEASSALYEWFRVLKPGGKVVIELPSLYKIAQHVVDRNKNMRLTLLGLFGDPRDKRPDMMHQWCYSPDELTEMLSSVGFTDIREETPVFHIAERDMRITGVKP